MPLMSSVRRLLVDSRHRSAIIDERTVCPRQGTIPVQLCMRCPSLHHLTTLSDAGGSVAMIVCEPPDDDHA